MSTATLHPEDARYQRVYWDRWAIGIYTLTLVSVLDLLLTVWLISTLGFWEDNPIVVEIFRATNSLWSIIIYKALASTLPLWLLFSYRLTAIGKLAVRVAMLMAALILVHWVTYFWIIAGIDPTELARVGRLDYNFIRAF